MSSKLLRIMALACVVVLALSGCNLVQIDETIDNETIVASFQGGTVTKGEVMPIYTSQKNYYDYLSMSYGYTLSTDGLLEDIVDQLVSEKILLGKAEEMGLSLTEEEEAAVSEEAAATYEETVQSYWSDYAQDGLTDDEIRADINQFFAENDYTIEAVEKDAREAKIVAKLQDAVYADVIVTPADIQNAYDELVAKNESDFTTNPASFETTAMTPDTTIGWMPAGYRTVKHILRKFDAEQTAAIDAINADIANLTATKDSLSAQQTADVTATSGEAVPMTAEQIEAYIAERTAEKDALVAEYAKTLTPVLEEIYAELDSGKPFEEVMQAYNEDPGMDSEPMATKGYYVCAGSTSWVPSFRDAAMALANIGDVSDPVLSDYGVHVLYYLSDVTPGAVPFADLAEEMEAQVTTQLQTKAYDESVALWKSDAKIQTNLSVIEK